MPVRFAAVVSWAALRDTVVIAIIAGVGLSMAFGFLILGGTRPQESYSQRRLVQAAAYGTLAAIALATTTAGIVIGLIVIADK